MTFSYFLTKLYMIFPPAITCLGLFGWVSSAGAAIVYYSVGQNTTDQKIGLPTVTIAGGAAVFSVAQTGNMGVGDQITYNGSSVAYVSGKANADQMHWTLLTATGRIPADVTNVAVNSITRAFGSLAAAQSGSSDANHLNTKNLVTGNFILFLPCYFDSGSDSSNPNFTGWATDSNHYIQIYTPVSTISEANQSQRHTGKWTATAFTIASTSSTLDAIRLTSLNSKVIGIQISLDAASGTNSHALHYESVGANTTWAAYNIIRKTGSSSSAYGIRIGSSGATVYIWNNMIYGFSGISPSDAGVKEESASGAYVSLFNNTIQGSNVGVWVTNTGGRATLVNNLFSGDTSSTLNAGAFATGSDYNATDNSSLGYPSSFHDRVSLTYSFINSANKDFHLALNDTGAKDYGTSNPDPGLFTDDIDGQNRPYGPAWDIGADEYTQ